MGLVLPEDDVRLVAVTDPAAVEVHEKIQRNFEALRTQETGVRLGQLPRLPYIKVFDEGLGDTTAFDGSWTDAYYNQVAFDENPDDFSFDGNLFEMRLGGVYRLTATAQHPDDGGIRRGILITSSLGILVVDTRAPVAGGTDTAVCVDHYFEPGQYAQVQVYQDSGADVVYGGVLGHYQLSFSAQWVSR